MDYQWGQRPSPQGNICPTCSFSHFPFCPPHPYSPLPPPPHPYNPNPRFPPPAHYPRPDPYYSSLPGPYEGWHGNPNFDYRDGYGPPMHEHGNFASNDYYVGEADRIYKRPRVDDVGSGAFGCESNQNPAGISADDERRLKLIRDHGGASGGNFSASYTRSGEMNNNVRNSCNDEPGVSGNNRIRNDTSNMYTPLQSNGTNQSHSLPYHVPEARIENYADRDLRRSQLGDSISANSRANNPQDHHPPERYGIPDYMRPDYRSPGQIIDVRQPIEVNQDGLAGHQKLLGVAQYGTSDSNDLGGYLPHPGNRTFGSQPPPLRASPPPPPPMEPHVQPPSQFKAYSSPPKTSLFPVHVNSSATNPYLHNKQLPHASTGFVSEEWQASSRQYSREGQTFLPNKLSPDKPTVIDAAQLFMPPDRATRPDHIVIILRGLPGSGKSYFAKMIRDIEIESGGDAPRIHSMDDYFMTEVEKVDESDASKSSSSIRGKKSTAKKVMEFCYEPEMEEAYRDSMLKAFKKTLEEGNYKFVIVDDRNLRVADFAQFWAIAKRSGYEVYISEATYKDPAGCAARNVHGFTLDEIQKMARQWEEAPSMYLQLDIKSLFRGDDLKESGIQEVDMDTEDGDFGNDRPGLEEREPEKSTVPPVEVNAPNVPPKDGNKWDAEEDHPTEEVKELGKSKWSNDSDEDETDGPEGLKGNLNALSGLIQAYGKQGKSVQWSDQVGSTGFSISAARKSKVQSLVIGPGAGYNLKSNPLPEDQNTTSTESVGKSRKQSIFQERIRAERESFKAVFERRQRIGVPDLDGE